jgi:hypothetical protein
MDDARSAPIVSPDQGEEFFATGYNARTSEPDAAFQVDVPAVGITPSAQLPSLGGEGVKRPEPLKTYLERNRQLSQLVFAARDLAESRIMKAWDRTGADLVTPSWCMECQHNEIHGSIVHAANCRTGRVLDVLLQLVQLAAKSSLADEARLKPLRERVCLKCGVRNGLQWLSREISEAEFRAQALSMNECWDAALTPGGMRVIHTHHCAAAEGGAQ